MVILIAGATHTGKTSLAQRLMERYQYPYFSIDHLKMGLIRSGLTAHKASDSDSELTAFLWPIVREMVKTVIENRQNLIIEGCYIPVAWEKDFETPYRKQIRCIRLVMSEAYIRSHFDNIRKYANIIEQRLDDSFCTIDTLLAENLREQALCQANGADYVCIDDNYLLDLEKNLQTLGKEFIL